MMMRQNTFIQNAIRLLNKKLDTTLGEKQAIHGGNADAERKKGLLKMSIKKIREELEQFRILIERN
jgi:hypothetical protein